MSASNKPKTEYAETGDKRIDRLEEYIKARGFHLSASSKKTKAKLHLEIDSSTENPQNPVSLISKTPIQSFEHFAKLLEQLKNIVEFVPHLQHLIFPAFMQALSQLKRSGKETESFRCKFTTLLKEEERSYAENWLKTSKDGYWSREKDISISPVELEQLLAWIREAGTANSFETGFINSSIANVLLLMQSVGVKIEGLKPLPEKTKTEPEPEEAWDPVTMAKQFNIIKPVNDAKSVESMEVDEVKENCSVAESILKALTDMVETELKGIPSVRLYRKSRGPNHPICADFSYPDCSLMAVGMENSSIELWRLRSDVELPNESDHSLSPFVLNLPKSTPEKVGAESPAKRILKRRSTVGISNSKPLIFSPRDDLQVLRGHSEPVYDVKFVPNPSEEGQESSRFLLSCSGDTTCRIFDMKLGGHNRMVYKGHNSAVWKLSVSPVQPHQRFVTASNDRTSRLFDCEIPFPIRTLAGHETAVDAVMYHPNGEYIATGATDRKVLLWSLNEARPVRSLTGFEGEVEALAFSPDGKYLAAAAEDRKLWLWDLGTGRLLCDELEGWHSDSVFSLQFHGDWLASAGADSFVKLWNWTDLDAMKKGPFNFRVSGMKKDSVGMTMIYGTRLRNYDSQNDSELFVAGFDV